MEASKDPQIACAGGSTAHIWFAGKAWSVTEKLFLYPSLLASRHDLGMLPSSLHRSRIYRSETRSSNETIIHFVRENF